MPSAGTNIHSRHTKLCGLSKPSLVLVNANRYVAKHHDVLMSNMLPGLLPATVFIKRWHLCSEDLSVQSSSMAVLGLSDLLRAVRLSEGEYYSRDMDTIWLQPSFHKEYSLDA